MREYSNTAWEIASKYSGVLASETRDLAAWIDDALDKERAECALIAQKYPSGACKRQSTGEIIADLIRERTTN